MMNPEIKEEWATALESGVYQQGRDQLRKSNKYCCLGVLCDIASKYGIGKWIDDEFETQSDSRITVLPNEVVHWAGLDDGVPSVIYNDSETHLAALNDDDELPFTEIAKIIRDQL